MFSVALPALRKGFRIEADLTAWLVTAQSLPFMMLMPLYGRMGDIFGRKRLLVLGIIVFLSGTIVVMVATNLPLFILGRIIQGIGASGVNPLCLAIITGNVSADQRGKALGYWNSIGPVANFSGPILAGLLIDYFEWRAIFVPIAIVAAVAFWAVSIRIPKDELDSADNTSLLSFDWLGGRSSGPWRGGGSEFTLSTHWRLGRRASLSVGVGSGPLQHDPFWGQYDWRRPLRSALENGIGSIPAGSRSLPICLLDFCRDRRCGNSCLSSAENDRSWFQLNEPPPLPTLCRTIPQARSATRAPPPLIRTPGCNGSCNPRI